MCIRDSVCTCLCLCASAHITATTITFSTSMNMMQRAVIVDRTAKRTGPPLAKKSGVIYWPFLSQRQRSGHQPSHQATSQGSAVPFYYLPAVLDLSLLIDRHPSRPGPTGSSCRYGRKSMEMVISITQQRLPRNFRSVLR